MNERMANMDELCDGIRIAANEVLSTLGHGFSEAVYEKALVVKMGRMGMGTVAEQFNIPYTFEGQTVGIGRMDILLTNPEVIGDAQLCIELKLEGSKISYTINEAIDQVWCYLRFMPANSRAMVVVFPKRPRQYCICVPVTKAATLPYVTPATVNHYGPEN